MTKKLRRGNRFIAIVVFAIITTFGCRPDLLEYARPESLAGTIYQQLESMGTFNYYLKSLDQTEFKEPLARGGSWTVFAPTDEAFEKYMQEEGYANFGAIPLQNIQDIIDYSIITDGWNTTTLTYFSNRFYEGQSFRRRTQYQRPYIEIDSDTLQHIRDWESGKYLVDISLGRLKTTDYFLDLYFDNWNIQYADYEFMFSGKTFNAGDMKVFEANVSQTNIVAENGIIYALDKVFEPKPNLYENLSAAEYEGKYSTFKKILERFATLVDVGDEVHPDTGVTETIHQLRFATGIENNFLPFNPADENYPSNIDATLAQAYGFLVPTNDALSNYLNGSSILGQFYESYDDMPLDVLGQFLSPYFFNDFYDICPSRFGQSYDTSLGLVDYKPADVVDKKFCSNGFFVGVNTVYINNSFGTIMGPLLLNPEYAIMLNTIQNLGIDIALQSKGVRFSILGVKNSQFVDVADPNSATRKITVLTNDSRLPNPFDPRDLSVIYMEVTGDPNGSNNRIYPDPGASNPSASDIAYVAQTLKDIVLNQIINSDIDFNANNYYQARSGEFVYAFNGNMAAGGGDIQEGESAQIVETLETDNGSFYEMSSIIERPLRFTYGALEADPNNSFSSFLEVLETADALITIVGSDDKLVNFLNLQKTFTLFAPNNTAVANAIAEGVIVEPNTVEGLSDLDKVIAKRDLLNFAKKHFLQQAIPTDGKTVGTFPSMYFSKVIDFAPVYDEFSISNTTTSISITNTETAQTVTTSSITNVLSKRVVIHEVDNYIK
ncbi:fasciclin domain-containing protein [uncultured Polaribacter sp.]|uniref:fasciclin domain-containing protein n=1 Tax=uncultured Polaribacter sp. TaxID=174711 RepID=UPI00261139E9|nr:fasciclin domain-containing protein [uncultured Polaribacter sp.]